MANIAPDINCPHCNQGHDIQEWMTEYGDPLVGEQNVECIECQQSFTLETEVITKYHTSK
jgi:transposase-like protein